MSLASEHKLHNAWDFGYGHPQIYTLISDWFFIKQSPSVERDIRDQRPGSLVRSLKRAIGKPAGAGGGGSRAFVSKQLALKEAKKWTNYTVSWAWSSGHTAGAQ